MPLIVMPQKYRLEDKLLKTFPEEIQKQKTRIAALQQDSQIAAASYRHWASPAEPAATVRPQPFVIVHHTFDGHTAEVFFVLRVCCCNL